MVKQKKVSLGMVITLMGVGIASIIMEFLKLNQSIAMIVMVVGIALLMTYKRKISGGAARQWLPVIVYLSIAIVAGILSGYSFIGGYAAVVYIAYCLALAIFMLAHKKEDYSAELFIEYGWWITGALNTILFPLLTQNFTSFSVISYLSQGSDRLTLAQVSITYLIFFLAHKSKNKAETVFQWVFAGVSIINILLCNVRRALLAYIIVLIIHFIRNADPKKLHKNIRPIVAAVIGIIALLFIFSRFQILQDLFERLIETARSSVLGYFGKATGMYNSGTIRNNQITSLWNEYNTSFTFKDVLFGKGYMYKHIDFPYFQAFTDLGLIMGILYAYVQFILPIRIIVRKPLDSAQQFFQYFMITVILENFYSGTPYGFDKFIPLILLMFVSKGATRQKEEARVPVSGAIELNEAEKN